MNFRIKLLPLRLCEGYSFHKENFDQRSNSREYHLFMENYAMHLSWYKT